MTSVQLVTGWKRRRAEFDVGCVSEGLVGHVWGNQSQTGRQLPIPGKMWGHIKERSCHRRRHQQSSFATVMAKYALFGITLFAALSSAIRPTILQPLPKHFKEGKSSVVYIKDRLNNLPMGFHHTDDGNQPGLLC
jgi:hypothetical protein